MHLREALRHFYPCPPDAYNMCKLMHVPCFQSVLVSSTVETGLPQNRMISSEHGWNRPVVPLLVSNLIQRIVLALWIWQVSLTFYARYQHPYLVLWRCHQKHMWPVWGPRRAQHIPKTGSSLHIATWTQQTTTWPCMLIQPFRAETSSYPDIFTGEHRKSLPWQLWAWRHGWATGTIR